MGASAFASSLDKSCHRSRPNDGQVCKSLSRRHCEFQCLTLSLSLSLFRICIADNDLHIFCGRSEDPPLARRSLYLYFRHRGASLNSGDDERVEGDAGELCNFMNRSLELGGLGHQFDQLLRKLIVHHATA